MKRDTRRDTQKLDQHAHACTSPNVSRFEPRHDKTNKMACAPSEDSDQTGTCAPSEDSDQTGRMPRLIWVFAGRTVILLVLSCRGSFKVTPLKILWYDEGNSAGDRERNTKERKTEISRDMTKPTKWHMRPAKSQISLGTRPVWSESSLCAQWVAKGPSFHHAVSEESSLGAQAILLVLSCRGSNRDEKTTSKHE